MVRRIRKIYWSLRHRQVIAQLIIRRPELEIVACNIDELERYPPKLLIKFVKDLIFDRVETRENGNPELRRYIEQELDFTASESD